MAVKTPSAGEQAAAPASAATRVRAVVTGYRYPLAVFAASRAAVYLLFAMVAWTHRVPPHSSLTYRSMFSPLQRWDAVWYHWIVAHGYDPAIGHGNTVAFYPLWPLVWRAFAVLPLPVYLVGSLVSTALFGVALCLLYRITLGRYDVVMARRATLYMAIWPLAFVYSVPYSESLYLLASLAAFALTWHGRWWLGSGAGALAVLTRPVGIALVPALAWRIYRKQGLRWRAYLPLLVMVAAQLGFFLYLGWRTGDWLGSTHAQHRGWGRGLVPLPIEIGRGLVSDVVQNGLLRTLADVAFTCTWCWLWYRAWRVMRLPGEYLIYAALLVLLPSSGGSLLSMGRMGMVAFPLMWALADWGRDERVDTLVKTLAPAMLAALVFLAFGTRTFVP
jgi:Mannosyltransferase (PIG-V)